MGIINYGQFVLSAILLNLVPGSDTEADIMTGI